MANPQSATTVVDNEKTLELSGKLCKFTLPIEGYIDRPWFSTDVTYGVLRKFFAVVPYDPNKGKGEQRDPIVSNINRLYKAMKGNNYTPSTICVGIRVSHEKAMVKDEKKRRVTLTIKADNPLPITDGGHRSKGLEKLWKEATTDEQKKAIEAIDVPIQIFLRPELIKRDFQNLNDSKAVSRSQLKMMREEELVDDAEKGPAIRVTQRAVALMDVAPETESFLHNDVNFTGGGSGKCDYSSLTAANASDLATSVTGGAKIVLYPSYEKMFHADKEKGLTREDVAADFLVTCYKSVWQGIYKYDEKEEIPNKMLGTVETFPELLLDGNMLRPNRLSGKGTKGGTGLNIMAGNMLAFYMLQVAHKTIVQPVHVKKVVAALRETLLQEVQGGGSGPAKRAATGEFIREFFKDDIRQTDDDQIDMNKMGAVDGVPTILCDLILTPSACNVPSRAQRAKANIVDTSTEAESKKSLSDPDQTMPGFDDDTPVGELETFDDADAPEVDADPDTIDDQVTMEADDDETEDHKPEVDFVPPAKGGKKKGAKVGLTG